LRPVAACRHTTGYYRFRLTAAGQVLQPDASRRRNLPFVILRGDRPLYFQQQPLESDGPHAVPSDSYPRIRPALRDPNQPLSRLGLQGLSVEAASIDYARLTNIAAPQRTGALLYHSKNVLCRIDANGYYCHGLTLPTNE